MEFALQNDGTPTYSLNYKSKAVVKPSKLGLELKMTKNHLNDFTVLDTKQQLLMDTCLGEVASAIIITNLQ
jgi:hypothetical protein